MSSIVGRWVGSAPILKTPRELQSEGPPPAFDDFDLPSKDHEKSLLPRNFDFCIPNPARAANDRHVDEWTYQKLLQYWYQLQVLLVLIWADMTLLFHPTSITYCIIFKQS